MRRGRRGAWLCCLALGACARSAAPTREQERPPFPAARLMEVCWPAEVPATARAALTFLLQDGKLQDVAFEVEGAPNSVGRCAREVAFRFPWAVGEAPPRLELAVPSQRPSGWVGVAYVDLLSGDAPPGRGLPRVGPLVSACLARGDGVRAGVSFQVQPNPTRVQLFSGERESAAVTDSERCVEAVLGSAYYPGTRPLRLAFAADREAPAAKGDVDAYFAPSGARALAPLEPGRVREALAARGAAVSACWDAALLRRPGLGGGRTFRIRVGEEGDVRFAHVIPNRSDASAEAADYLLDSCLHAVLLGTRFSNPEGQMAEAVYSWVFAHR